MGSYGALVLVEVVLVLGGALAFAWWQLRDVERAQREARERRAREATDAGSAAQSPAQDAVPGIVPPAARPDPAEPPRH